MSGSSLDGLDIGLYKVNISKYPRLKLICIKSETIPYPQDLRSVLQSIDKYSIEEYYDFEYKYSEFIAVAVRSFCDSKLPCDLIGLHGHTIFHKPDKGYSVQLGNGGIISELTAVPCITDFRIQDITRGGEGAPMAPLIDTLLFPGYDAYLNLGGIANITLKEQAYDIAPFNQVINYIAKERNLSYDKNGRLGKSGEIVSTLLTAFRTFPYYNITPPKSLDNGVLQDYFYPLIDSNPASTPDKMHTFYIHIASEIASHLPAQGKCFVTGGGAFNTYFLNCLEETLDECELYLPDKNTIEFKESLLMAIAALLRYKEIPNYINTFTTADTEVSAGALYIHATDENRKK